MGFGTIFELQAGVVERFRVTPTSRLALLLGPLVSGMSWMFLFDLVLVVVGIAFGFHVHVGGLLVLAVLLGLFMVAMASFSVAVALVIGTIEVTTSSAPLASCWRISTGLSQLQLSERDFRMPCWERVSRSVPVFSAANLGAEAMK